MKKEQVFDVIDEYMELKKERVTIKCSEKNKDKILGMLLMSTTGFSGFRNNIFTISKIDKRRLDKKGIKYEVVL